MSPNQRTWDMGEKWGERTEETRKTHVPDKELSPGVLPGWGPPIGSRLRGGSHFNDSFDLIVSRHDC